MAIKFAAKTHNQYQDQKRKGKTIPYITHPLTLGIILAGIGASEDVVVAGILHDTIEDSVDDKKVTPEMLIERFGKNVSDLVMSVTEVDKSMSWADRKKEAIEHIKHFSNDSVLVKSADIISNVSELLDDYERYGDEVFERFKASKEDIIENILKTTSAVIDKWKKNPLVKDLRFLVTKLSELSEIKADSAIHVKNISVDEVGNVSKLKSVEFSKEDYSKIEKVVNFFLDSGQSENQPKFVIFMGGVGSGKTTIRRQDYSNGYVNFEYNEILIAVKKELGESHPNLVEYASVASDMILTQSLESKKNIVIEIIGADKDLITPVIDKMTEIGYEVSFRYIHCDVLIARERHLKAVEDDLEYLSAYFTERATLSFFYSQLELGEMPTSLQE